MILQRYNTYQTHWQRICREIENGTYKRHVHRGASSASATARAPDRGERAAARAPQPATSPRAAGQALPSGPRRPSWPSSIAEFAPMLELADDDLELDGAVRRLLDEGAAPSGGQGRARQSPPGDGSPSSASVRRASHPRGRPRQPPGPVGAAATSPAGREPPSARLTAAGRPAPPPPLPPAAPPRHLRPRRAPAPPSELPDERVRQLYAQYVDTKRQQNESTAAITYEAVAKSLRDRAPSSREARQGRRLRGRRQGRQDHPQARPQVRRPGGRLSGRRGAGWAWARDDGRRSSRLLAEEDRAVPAVARPACGCRGPRDPRRRRPRCLRWAARSVGRSCTRRGRPIAPGTRRFDRFAARSVDCPFERLSPRSR